MPGTLMLGGPARPHVHRMLRLIMTAAAVAAGLCLVVGMVTLVAATGSTGPSKAGQTVAPGQRSGGSRHTSQPGGGNHGVSGGLSGPGSHARMTQGGHFHIGHTVAVFDGSGTGEPGPFTIRRPGSWGLSWSYSCPKGKPGNFVLGETHTSIGLNVSVRESGPAGHGMYWVTGDTGPHSLVVASECTWRLRIVMPAAGG
jgi:hypothetical protein